MIKRVMAVLLGLTLVLGLAGCGAAKLSAAFDENVVKESAAAIVALGNAAEFGEMETQVREDLRTGLSQSVIADAWKNVLGDAGNFVEISRSTVSGTKDSKTGEDYATAVLVCKYEKGSHTITVSFDANMEVVGLFLR